MNLAFELRRPRHAINEFLGSVRLFDAINPVVFMKVAEKLERLSEELRLPALIPQSDAETIGFGSDLGQYRVGYRRFAQDGEVSAALVCDPQSVTLSRRDYTTWDDIGSEMISAFKGLLEIYITDVPAINSFRLQYENELSHEPRSAKLNRSV